MLAGIPLGLGASGVEGLGGAPAFLKADVEGASLMGVPTLGVFEVKGDCVGSSTIIAEPEEPFSATAPEMLDRRSGCPSAASACAGSCQKHGVVRNNESTEYETIIAYRPLGPDHPTTRENLAIFSNRPDSIWCFVITNSEAIKYFRIGFRLCRIPK